MRAWPTEGKFKRFISTCEFAKLGTDTRCANNTYELLI